MGQPLLLISYLFPPFGGVGVQRPLSYARFLPQCGFDVFVVTARNAATALRDPSLLESVPRQTRVHGTFTPEIPFHWRERIWSRITSSSTAPSRQSASGDRQTPPGPSTPRAWKRLLRDGIQKLVTPDPQVVWVPWATREAAALIRRHGIKTVLVSAPPFSSLEIGVRLKRQFPSLKLISEFRDEWLNHYLSMDRGATPSKIAEAQSRERSVVEASDYVIAVTSSQREMIAARYPGQPASKFLTIPNGYDPEMFSGFPAPAPEKRSRLVVTYMGTSYLNAIYSPIPYLNALAALPPTLQSRIETHFIGRVADSLIPFMDQCPSPVRRLGFLPQRTAFQRLRDTDLLLLIVNSRDSQAGKLFEYLATGKPILALTPPDGEVAALLRRTGTGLIHDVSDLQGITERLKSLLNQAEVSSGDMVQPDWDEIHQYQRPRLVASMVEATGLRQEVTA